MATNRKKADASTNASNTATEAPRSPTFDPNDPVFKAAVAEAVAAAMAVKEASKREGTEIKIINAFTKAGFKDVVLFDRTRLLVEQPTVTVLTYDRWLELGRKVRPGEHAVKVKGYFLRLFHKTQTEIMATVERKEAFKRLQEKAARREARAAAAAAAAAG